MTDAPDPTLSFYEREAEAYAFPLQRETLIPIFRISNWRPR